jgi:mhaB1
LTGEGAAIVALAVAVATAGTGSGISAAITGSAGSATVGAMAGSAFTALVSQASISLINNQGNVKAALKEFGSKENVRGLAFAMATAGVSAKLDKTLAKYPIKTGQNSAFSDKVIKGIGEGVSRGILENVVYGTDLEDALVKNLKGQLTNAATAAAFSDFVKHMDADSGDQNLVIKNISHKLAAALTGCISAAANSQSCESGAVGAAVGEMFGDFVVDKNTGVIDEKQREKLINQARLLAGISAAFSGNDVNTAADKAGEAGRWNAIGRGYSENKREYTPEDIPNILNDVKKLEKEGRNHGLILAPNALNHYINGKGKDFEVKDEFLLKFSSISKADKINQDRFIKHEKGIINEIQKMKSNNKRSFHIHFDKLVYAEMFF